jgi:hypothetical protein
VALFEYAGLREASPGAAFEAQARKSGFPEAFIQAGLAKFKVREAQ